MRITSVSLFTTALSLAALPHFATAALEPIPEIKRVLPPAGVEIPAKEKADLQRGLDSLKKNLAQVAKHPLAPDAEVFAKAVEFYLVNGEHYKPEDLKTAAELLKAGEDRCADLKAGKTPWEKQTGPVVRGFRSAIDGSVQPYGVDTPKDFDFGKPAKAYIWLHGRGDAMTDLPFVAERMKKGSQFAPPADTIVIHPFGRQCVGFKGPGEADVLEGLAHLSSRYKTDENRIALMGFSMGGAGAWMLGAHYTGKWAVVHAGAGYVDVRRFTRTDPANVAPWTVTLWGHNDVAGYARNFLNVPLVAYSGEKDGQKLAADIIEEVLAKEGLTLKHLIGPGKGHEYHPDQKKQVEEFVTEALVKGRPADPLELHFQTQTLRYSDLRWLRVEGLEQHWSDSRVDASRQDGKLTLTTQNITSLRVALPAASSALIDGQKVAWGAGRWEKLGGKWQPAASPAPTDLRKRPGLQGPMDDAIVSPFLVVLPSKPCASPMADRWVKFESERFAKFWREVFRGEVRVKKDTEVTGDDIRDYNLVLWGDPVSNTAISRIAPKLPVRWENSKIAVGSKTFSGADHLPALIYPNPLNPNRYVVINNGCSFREAPCANNSLQNPLLPDWTVFDLNQLPDKNSAAKIEAAGFFDERWQLK